MWLAVIGLVLLLGQPLRAATYTVTTNQNWSAFSPQPTSADAIVVQSGATLTADVTNGICASIQLGISGGGNSGTLSFPTQAGKVVTCTGNVTLGQGNQPGTL